MSVYHHIRQLRNFDQQGLIFPENDKKWFSFVFTVFLKHIKIESPFKYDSVCGRVVKSSGLSSALSSYYCSITGSILDGARFTHHFFSVILNYCCRESGTYFSSMARLFEKMLSFQLV